MGEAGEYYIVSLRYHIAREDNNDVFEFMLKCCEDIRPEISDKNILMRLDALLFDSYMRKGDRSRAMDAIRAYSTQVNQIVSNLQDQSYVEQFTKSDEVAYMTKRFEALKKKPTRELV